MIDSDNTITITKVVFNQILGADLFAFRDGGPTAWYTDDMVVPEEGSDIYVKFVIIEEEI